MATEKTRDSVNGIDINVLNETIEAVRGDPELGRCEFRARNTWTGGTRNCTAVEGFYGAKQEMKHQRTYQLEADEPPILAGGDEAPNPVEHLLNALASCLTTSMVAHAAVRGINIEEVQSEVEGDIDLRGFLGLADDVPKGYSKIRINFRVKSDASPEQLESLAKFSPVFNTLMSGVEVDLRVENEQTDVSELLPGQETGEQRGEEMR